MPIKKLILNAKIETQSDLTDKLAGLHLTDKLTQPQAASALTFLRANVPCLLRISMRTDKGVMYVQSFGDRTVAFTVSPRAKVELVLDSYDD